MPPQTPLGPIWGNRTRKQELSPYPRDQIVAFKAAGVSLREISRRTGLSSSTIRYTISKVPSRDQGKSIPRSRRPPKVSRTDERNTLKIVRKNPKITYAELEKESDIHVSRPPFAEFLQIMESRTGLQKWPYLTPEAAKKRYEWVKI